MTELSYKMTFSLCFNSTVMSRVVTSSKMADPQEQIVSHMTPRLKKSVLNAEVAYTSCAMTSDSSLLIWLVKSIRCTSFCSKMWASAHV